MKSIPTCYPNKEYGARGYCRTCYNTWLRKINPAYKNACYESSKRIQQAHPERRKNYWLKFRYGITHEFVEQQKTQQKFACLICERKRELVVDHCHKTGKFRGLICNTCNMYVGVVENTNNTIVNLQRYLK